MSSLKVIENTAICTALAWAPYQQEIEEASKKECE